MSALGELIWYLSASNDIGTIEYYIPGYREFSDDDQIANGAYGPRIFSTERIQQLEKVDQWQRVIDTLRARNGSRNGVIQLFRNDDAMKESKDIPCTCTLHFFIRARRVHLHVHMRSNDAVLGMPHDVFSFTMLQEIAARELEIEIGNYFHSVASLHLYDDTSERKPREMARNYIDEGKHDLVPMPPMPLGDPWASIRNLIIAEADIRNGQSISIDLTNEAPYWADLTTLLEVFATSKAGGSADQMTTLMRKLHSPVYRTYILDRIARRLRPDQGLLDLFGKVTDHDRSS